MGAGQSAGDAAEVLRVRHDAIRRAIFVPSLAPCSGGFTPSHSLPHQGGGLREAAEIVRTHFLSGAGRRREAAHAEEGGVEVEIADFAEEGAGLWRA
jgi:hypothetical protein